MNDRYWMQQAYDLAQKAAAHGEVPVGAVLIGPEHQRLGEGYNRVIQHCDPTAHAEMVAIRQAAQHTENYRLLNTTLYVTLEPCAMCAAAMVHARIKRLVFATRDFQVGAAGSICNLLKGPPWNHSIQIDEGMMAEECSGLLTSFFQDRRAESLGLSIGRDGSSFLST